MISKLRNYTSEVPVSRSLELIDHRLVQAGAKNILRTYSADKRVEGMVFTLPGPNGLGDLPVELPARVDQVEAMMRKRCPRPPRDPRKLRDQAERTAWKNLAEWVDIQLLLIELHQVEPLEVFLPYLHDPKRKKTFYGLVKESGFKMLPGGAL